MVPCVLWSDPPTASNANWRTSVSMTVAAEEGVAAVAVGAVSVAAAACVALLANSWALT